MTSSSLHAALRAGASGLYALEGGTGLVIAHGPGGGRDRLGSRDRRPRRRAAPRVRPVDRTKKGIWAGGQIVVAWLCSRLVNDHEEQRRGLSGSGGAVMGRLVV
jgi:hypothetical protein